MVDAVEHLVYAELLLSERRLDSARKAYDDAQLRGADWERCSAGRWMISMLAGRFCEAWRESDAIRLRGAADPHRFWEGEDLRGAHVIVRSLHGLGDAVQMLRYAPVLNALASRVVFEVPPRFVELARCFDRVDEVITWEGEEPVRKPEWNVQLEVMEFPYIFRTTESDLPLCTNYVRLKPEVVRSAADALNPAVTARETMRIGMVWSGGDWDSERSVPFSLLHSCLQNTPGACQLAEFWSLQGGMVAQDANGTNVRDAASQCGSGLMGLAATIANLDLVITIDTLAAHLAGALGKPTWVLLQYAADWRWMVERPDSPWYPTVRLFRQKRPGDWSSVMQEVRDSLELLLKNAPGPKTC
ncbi:MAG: hypothetical protein M3Y50_07760 [Acidobacteriota bacterium]|nr:hypothetical protein [Acidobacteriota bacterium]